jgi:hypothetical protein
MGRTTSAVIPIIQAAESLAQQAWDVLQLHRQEVPGRSPRSWPTSKPQSTPSTKLWRTMRPWSWRRPGGVRLQPVQIPFTK